MLSLEWRFVALGGYSDFYMERGVLNSGKVIVKNYNFICSFRTENCSQWRIQDFPEGAPTIYKLFAQNRMKMKEFGFSREARPGASHPWIGKRFSINLSV